MQRRSAFLSMAFSCLGHAYMHMFTAFYFVIVLTLETSWELPYHELIELWTLGAFLVGLCALPSGWLADRWSSRGMMVIYFIGLGLAGIICGLVEGPTALLLGLAAIGVFSAIYHPVGVAWLVRNAVSRGRALGINGIFGSIGVASAGLVAGGLIDLFGWRAAFIIPGVVSLSTGLLLWVGVLTGQISEGAGDRKRDPPPGRGEMMRVFAVLALTMMLMGIIFQATQAALPKVFDIRLRDLAGEGALGVGALVASVYLAGGLMQVIGGFLADRYPLKPLYFGAFLLQVPILVGIAAFSGAPLISVAVITVILTQAPLPAENMLLARFTPERHRSLAFGVKFVLAFATAPLALQMVSYVQRETGEFHWLFGLLAALALMAALAALCLPGERKPQPLALPAEG